jgi:pyruvate dehydrogenase E2 component (dihydrolipoamide acetyltransferase)
MSTAVIMPALELAQETGKVIRWLKAPGDAVTQGEPIVEIETDKVTTELEAPASGILGEVTAQEGDVVPVGHAIAIIAAPSEAPAARPAPVKASPLARKIAEQHGVDLARIATRTGRIEKADVLAHVESRASAAGATQRRGGGANGSGVRLGAASPKARRLAAERGLDIDSVRGSGPDGAVLAEDVLAAHARPGRAAAPPVTHVGAVQGTTPTAASPRVAAEPSGRPSAPGGEDRVGTVWRIMAERMTASWTSAPHFYLVREVVVSRLAAWRAQAGKQAGARVTYTDLLVKLVAATLLRHPRVNASWNDGAIARHPHIDIGLAVAVDDGLVVPVIHRADTLGVGEIAARRDDLVSRAQRGKLRPADIQGGGFTISNLGMYGVDAFDAIVNPPQAAILAVGRIADRVVAVDGQPAVRPTMVLTLSCDHRALDGARAAEFLGALADLVEEPLALLG